MPNEQPNEQIGNDYIRSWISTLASTSGIMLTISLGVLTILFTSNATLLQITVSGTIIGISSVLLVTSLILLVMAHGTLILVVSAPSKLTEKEKTYHESLKKKLRFRSRIAERTFIAGALLIFVAIFLTVLMAHFRNGF